MFSQKKIAIGAGIGFTISLIAGIIGGVGFTILFFRAILSGCLFAGLGFGIDALCKKYLFNKEYTTILQKPTSDSFLGSTVDITLGDDDLPDSEVAPSFFIDGNNLSDEEDSILQTETSDDLAVNASQDSLVNTDSLPQEASGGFENERISSSGENEYELDTLPDMGNFDSGEADSSANANTELIKDTEFAETGKNKPMIPADFSDAGGDVRDIAAAIRTVLIKDA